MRKSCVSEISKESFEQNWELFDKKTKKLLECTGGGDNAPYKASSFTPKYGVTAALLMGNAGLNNQLKEGGGVGLHFPF